MAKSGDAARVTVRNLTKRFKSRSGEHIALDNVSLDIAQGEFVVLLGPSGCGKTTLLRSIAGLEQPDGGEICIDGDVVSSHSAGIWLPPEKRDLGMVFQSYALWPHMNVFENVAYPLRNARHAASQIRLRVGEALARVGLARLSESFPGQLSGGQQQRVALARAMVATGRLVLFDEPLSNLDAKVRARLRVELATLQREQGFASLYVTHDQSEALALADRLAVMEFGRIVQVGPPAEIYSRPATRYVADFVGSANEIIGEVTHLEGPRCKVATHLGDLTGIAGSGIQRIGQKVSVMCRPEHCRVGDPAAGDNTIAATLERSLFQGALYEHVFRAGDTMITVSEMNGQQRSPGVSSDIHFSVERTMIFPAATDVRS